jgi:hypothetical protein
MGASPYDKSPWSAEPGVYKESHAIGNPLSRATTSLEAPSG